MTSLSPDDSRGRGVLTFASPPDFENPADADRDNVYEVTVEVTDNDQSLTDRRLDVNEWRSPGAGRVVDGGS